MHGGRLRFPACPPRSSSLATLTPPSVATDGRGFVLGDVGGLYQHAGRWPFRALVPAVRNACSISHEQPFVVLRNKVLRGRKLDIRCAPNKLQLCGSAVNSPPTTSITASSLWSFAAASFRIRLAEGFIIALRGQARLAHPMQGEQGRVWVHSRAKRRKRQLCLTPNREGHFASTRRPHLPRRENLERLRAQRLHGPVDRELARHWQKCGREALW